MVKFLLEQKLFSLAEAALHLYAMIIAIYIRKQEMNKTSEINVSNQQ